MSGLMRVLVIAGTAITSCATLTASFTPVRALTAGQLDRAIETGQSNVPLAPYRLSLPIGQLPGQTVAIYTPYLRVALAARVAHERGRSLSRAELPGWMTEPTVLAVFRTPCESGRCAERMPEYAEAKSLTVYTGPLVDPDDASQPKMMAERITQDLKFLDELGGIPFEGAIVAAWFQPEAIRPGTSILAEWSNSPPYTPGQFSLFSGGQLLDAEMAAWK